MSRINTTTTPAKAVIGRITGGRLFAGRVVRAVRAAPAAEREAGRDAGRADALLDGLLDGRLDPPGAPERAGAGRRRAG
ncbi:MAG: hypothetical protein IPJ14_09275 [Kineosporiaceae bacterium]|nr:hypothetical protein [Kineosporiaceae bacterium]MBK7622836.1 hypothetical protein [Kineosporiaceae bacterium]MBK8078107.1 hypothetical protein [Kineosporiaceae bacterium]